MQKREVKHAAMWTPLVKPGRGTAGRSVIHAPEGGSPAAAALEAPGRWMSPSLLLLQLTLAPRPLVDKFTVNFIHNSELCFWPVPSTPEAAGDKYTDSRKKDRKIEKIV